MFPVQRDNWVTSLCQKMPSAAAAQYMASTQKSTAVTACVTGNFTSKQEVNLVLVKNTRLELYLATEEGLKPLKEIPINGKIAILKVLRYGGKDKDLLFVVTSRYNAMILEFLGDGKGKFLDVITVAHGNICDRGIGKPAENGIAGIIDPEARVIGLKLDEGVFKLIPLGKDNPQLQTYNIRLHELQIVDIEFMYGCENPTIIMIHDDFKGRHVTAREIDLIEKDFNGVSWKQENVESHASILIPVPLPVGGVIIIGQESIMYHNGSNIKSVSPAAMKRSTIICYARLDQAGSRYLLGDLIGRLLMLFLEREEKPDMSCWIIKDIKVEVLGIITIPNCITYLDNCVVFIGSRMGDSQLIRLNTEADTSGSYVSLMETFTNLAPIVDMIVVDLDKQGQGQLITCSGAYKEGSLRIIRNGIGIEVHASIDLPGTKGLWSLKVGGESIFDNMLVVSSIGNTRFLYLNGEEVEETDLPVFIQGSQTLWASNVCDDQMIQVITEAVRLVEASSKTLLTEWKPPSGKGISVVAANAYQIVCAAGSELYYLDIGKGTICLQGDKMMENEIACLDITPLGVGKTDFIAVGLWTDVSALILTVPALQVVAKEPMKGGIIPRSILLASFDDNFYLMCSLGDGSLFYFTLNPITGALTDTTKVTLGTQPTVLKFFKSQSTTNVFVCSDRPTVIYWSNHKLVFSTVNLKEVSHMCPLNAMAFPDTLVLATENSLVIGTIDEIQKLHIRTVPLKETPRRIVYQESTQTFGVITMRVDMMDVADVVPSEISASTQAASASRSFNKPLPETPGPSYAPKPSLPPPVEYGQDVEVNSMVILDQHNFKTLHSHQFVERECVMCIESCQLGGEDSPHYYVVGTALVVPDEPEPKAGRIVVFQFVDGKIIQITERQLGAACYCVVSFNEKIVAGVGSTVRLFYMSLEKELIIECSYFKSILVLYLKCKGDFILVGDLMRSMTLLQYNTHGAFEEVSRDHSPNWMTAVELIDCDTFLGADNACNMFVCTKDGGADAEDESNQMQDAGKIYLGDMINTFRHGSLVKQHLGDSSVPTSGSILFGTLNGSIGLVTQIPIPFYDLLLDLQERLTTAIKPVGKIPHSFWRTFSNGRKLEPCKGIIDGDLIESFLDLPRDVMEEVVTGLQVDSQGTGIKEQVVVDDIIKIVDDLSRIH